MSRGWLDLTPPAIYRWTGVTFCSWIQPCKVAASGECKARSASPFFLPAKRLVELDAKAWARGLVWAQANPDASMPVFINGKNADLRVIGHNRI